MRVESHEWLEKAEEDLQDASWLLEGKRWAGAAFHSQQAVEKALKALQIERTGKLSKIHDVIALAKIVGGSEKIVQACEEVNPHYLATRYSDSASKISPKMAIAALTSARRWLYGYAFSSLKK